MGSDFLEKIAFKSKLRKDFPPQRASPTCQESSISMPVNEHYSRVVHDTQCSHTVEQVSPSKTMCKS